MMHRVAQWWSIALPRRGSRVRNPVSCLGFPRQLHIGFVLDKEICTSGSVVEYRLAKARVAGSNPVSCFFYF